MKTHLNALQLRLSNERLYLANAKSKAEKELRQVWIKQIEKEIASEMPIESTMSDDDLLNELLK